MEIQANFCKIKKFFYLETVCLSTELHVFFHINVSSAVKPLCCGVNEDLVMGMTIVRASTAYLH